MHLLLTRPIDQAQRTAALLAERGWSCDVSPLMQLVATSPASWPAWRGIDAVIVTSANAVPGFDQADIPTSLPIYCVGDRSAALILQRGYPLVQSFQTSGQLAEFLLALPQPPAKIVHLCGLTRTTDLQDSLRGGPISYLPVVVYQADAIAHFPGSVCQSITAGHYDGVLLYSPRSATLFARAFTACVDDIANLPPINCYCLSQQVAAAIGDASGESIAPRLIKRVSVLPTEQALIELVAADAALRPIA